MKSAALFLLLSVTSGLGGNPRCEDVAPGKRGQTSECPYTIELSQDVIDSDQSVRIDIKASAGTQGFREFMLMAFEANQDTVPIGTFSSLSERIQVIDCPGLKKGGVTHVEAWWLTLFGSIARKTFESLIWTPEKDFQGDVIFRATFVHSRKIYWIDQTSSTLHVWPESTSPSSSIEPTTEPSSSSSSIEPTTETTSDPSSPSSSTESSTPYYSTTTELPETTTHGASGKVYISPILILLTFIFIMLL